MNPNAGKREPSMSKNEAYKIMLRFFEMVDNAYCPSDAGLTNNCDGGCDKCQGMAAQELADMLKDGGRL